MSIFYNKGNRNYKKLIITKRKKPLKFLVYVMRKETLENVILTRHVEGKRNGWRKSK